MLGNLRQKDSAAALYSFFISPLTMLLKTIRIWFDARMILARYALEQRRETKDPDLKAKYTAEAIRRRPTTLKQSLFLY